MATLLCTQAKGITTRQGFSSCFSSVGTFIPWCLVMVCREGMASIPPALCTISLPSFMPVSPLESACGNIEKRTGIFAEVQHSEIIDVVDKVEIS